MLEANPIVRYSSVETMQCTCAVQDLIQYLINDILYRGQRLFVLPLIQHEMLWLPSTVYSVTDSVAEVRHTQEHNTVYFHC